MMDMGMQKLANEKALANAAGNSLKHSLLAKNNQLRKVTPEQQRSRREHVPLSEKEVGQTIQLKTQE